MDELDAIARLKQGDISGLKVLVKSYQVAAVRAAYLITQEQALAEDVVQAAFIRAYERIDQFDAQRPFKPWFMRMVVNDAIKQARRRQRLVPLTDHDEMTDTDQLIDPNPGPDELMELTTMQDGFQQALKQLPPAQRAAIVMRYFLDMSEAEMSEQLQVPPGTVKWRLHAGRKRLQRILQRVNLEDPNG